jgi:hypothetical protein
LNFHGCGPRFCPWCVAQFVQLFVDGPAARPLDHFKVDGFEKLDGAFQVGNIVPDETQPQHVRRIRFLREYGCSCEDKAKRENENEQSFFEFHDGAILPAEI